MSKPKVFRSKIKGRYVGAWKAQAYKDGRRHVWSVTDGDAAKSEAEKLAAEEWARRQAVAPARAESPQAKRPPSRGVPAPLSAVQDAIAKAAAPAPEAAPSPTPGGEGPAPVVVGEAPPAESATPQTPELPDPAVKLRHLHTTVGNALALVLEGATKRAVRWAGREPDGDFSDDQQEITREGCSELAARWLGQTELGPAGKIAVGCGMGGLMLYMGGTPIKKPKPEPRDVEPIGGRVEEQKTDDAAAPS